jgi:hypothetical protein
MSTCCGGMASGTGHSGDCPEKLRARSYDARRWTPEVAKRFIEEFSRGERELVVEVPGVAEELTLEDPLGGAGRWRPLEVPAALVRAVMWAARCDDFRLLVDAARALRSAA